MANRHAPAKQTPFSSTPNIPQTNTQAAIQYVDDESRQRDVDIISLISNSSDKNYVHNQDVASALWTVTHNLEKYPSVSVRDSGGSAIIGTVVHINTNSLTISFSYDISGSASMN